MKKIIVLLLSVSLFTQLYAWGFHGHKLINKMAVYSLPPEMMVFYKAYSDYVSEHAPDPDKRRYTDTSEACRHYIDLDYYEKNVPIDTVPLFWKEAVTKFSEDTLLANGIVPWHIQRMLYRLTEAFESGNTYLILRTSAEIGHYVADACVPLHTTMNYNGQLTGQHGIHGLWESRIPELFSDEYNFYTGGAIYLKYPQQAIWKSVSGSYLALDSVLTFEKNLSATFPESKKYEYSGKDNKVKTYAYEYTEAYNQLLSGMVERRMNEAVLMVSSVWYTAWVNAGMPDLSKLTDAAKLLKKDKPEISEISAPDNNKNRVEP